MTYEEAVNYIHSLPKTGGRRGTGRISRLLEQMGNPQDKLSYIHIAGTNGKGSVTAMCAGVLAASGYRCGMCISPFVSDFRERFQMNGELISEEELKNEILSLKEKIEKMEEAGEWVSEFEAVTAIAFSYFSKHCDIVCLEVGIGGANDATNVILTPLVSVLTSVSLDHVQILGDTIEQIAREKAGIIKPHGICVCYPRQDIDAAAVFLEACAETNSRFVQPNPNSVQIESQTIAGNRFQYDGHHYETGLVGEHQIYNAVTVIEVMKQLRMKGMNIPQNAVEEGIKAAKLPARFEVMRQNPMIILDGAHNAEAMEKLAESLKKMKSGNCTVIVGMMRDKDMRLGMEAVCGEANQVICVPVNCPRAVAPEELSELGSLFCERVTAEDNLQRALELGLSQVGENGTLVICGSFYLAGEMREVIFRYFKN